MTVTVILSLCLAWYVVGLSGYIYWWTKDYDLEFGDLPVGLAVALAGPITFVVGFFIHSDKPVLLKPLLRRRK